MRGDISLQLHSLAFQFKSNIGSKNSGEYRLPTAMRYLSLLGTSLLGMTGCDRLAAIPYTPDQSPETWLQIQPFMVLKIGSAEIVLVQPSSSIFVYLLGIIAIGVGIYFFHIQENYQSRKWWGVALVLWGLGALFAGTSYQAFSYEIKCSGQSLCSWTSWWEIIYLILSVASINALFISGTYSSSGERNRKLLRSYAILNTALYSFLIMIGIYVLNKFLLSFELLLIFTAPTILILLLLNGWRFYKYGEDMDFALLITWIWLGVTIGAYFGYLTLGFTDDLWESGIWFSENDVLHIGLMSWMIFIAVYVAKRVTDMSHNDLSLSRTEGF